MTTGRSYAQVLDLLRRVPRPPEAGEVVGATDEQLAALEARVQQTLPTQLRDWLAVCNGAIAGPGLLLGAGTDNPDLDIAFNQSLWPEWQEQRWLPVATDGVGNAYVVTNDAQDSADAVYFVDCSEDPGSLAYVGASSLVNFLVFLLGKELGERRWPFDAGYVTEQDPAITSAPGAPLPWAA